MVERKLARLAKPRGRWVYYILADNILWPCPVHWEWLSEFGCWVPFYLAPSLEFIAGDPARAIRVNSKLQGSQKQHKLISSLRKQRMSNNNR